MMIGVNPSDLSDDELIEAYGVAALAWSNNPNPLNHDARCRDVKVVRAELERRLGLVTHDPDRYPPLWEATR